MLVLVLITTLNSLDSYISLLLLPLLISISVKNHTQTLFQLVCDGLTDIPSYKDARRHLIKWVTDQCLNYLLNGGFFLISSASEGKLSVSCTYVVRPSGQKQI